MPHCGAGTEVYSRITGYYRPVQNWNDGKTQEFKDRREYNIRTSRLDPVKHPEGAAAEAAAVCEAPAEAPAEEGMFLFTTPSCPNCKLAAALLEKAGKSYQKLIAEEHADLVAQFGVKQAPTLVVVTAEGFEKFRGVSDIKKYLSSL